MSNNAPGLELPARVVRKLCRGRWGRRARNVLAVGRDCEAFIERLAARGINAHGVDEGGIAGGFPFPPHYFDLIVVADSRPFDRELSGPEPLIATANLLSSLRPRGRLLFLIPAEPSAEMMNPARADLLAGHLRRFPGEVATSHYHDGWERYVSLEWWTGKQRNVSLQTVTMTTPRKAISRLQWHQHARTLVLASATGAPRERAA